MIRRPPRSTLFPHPPLSRSIGTDPTGTTAVPNFQGVFVNAGSSNVIGGQSTSGDGNVISGNSTAGGDREGNRLNSSHPVIPDCALRFQKNKKQALDHYSVIS